MEDTLETILKEFDFGRQIYMVHSSCFTTWVIVMSEYYSTTECDLHLSKTSLTVDKIKAEDRQIFANLSLIYLQDGQWQVIHK